MIFDKAQCCEWARDFLIARNDQLESESFIVIKDTPFSFVAIFSTRQGRVYLKVTPALISEYEIMSILKNEAKISVPDVIGFHQDLHAFLMKDAGKSLREILKSQFQLKLLCQAAENFSQSQIAAIPHLSSLVKKGVPQWNTSVLAQKYREILYREKTILLSDGVTSDQYNQLLAEFPKIYQIFQKLLETEIPDTIVQPDFNDNNILQAVDQSTLISIDLGELSISQPFFSLVNFLFQVTKHHGLQPTHSDYQKIRDAYLKPYLVFASEEELLLILDLIWKVWPIYQFMAYHRLVQAVGFERMQKYQPSQFQKIVIDIIKNLDAEDSLFFEI